MNSRQRFATVLNGLPTDRLQWIESKFADDTIELWRSWDWLDERSPEKFFGLDRHESVPVQMRKFDPPDDPHTIWPCPERWYDANDPRRFPSGLDYLDVRKQYGPRLRLMGGINNAALRTSDETIRKELERKVPALLESGRYLPGLDDTVRITIPFERFVMYRKLLVGIVEGG